jgi:glutamine synthetase type III
MKPLANKNTMILLYGNQMIIQPLKNAKKNKSALVQLYVLQPFAAINGQARNNEWLLQ